ncbi:penicillin-binding protein [Bacillus sp. FJAT-45037]|uniref:penicillin-binding protein n=1 Tax=Bacillus sp. FJAT-45037 TaxID=2011007 RepID=UPI000C23DBB7|nr:penicillin-binding protein [Bacillus sp. FJAT-45037]
MEIKRASTNKRAVLVLALFLTCFVLLTGRFTYIQVTQEVQGKELKAMGEERWSKEQVIEGKRGTIYDRRGSAVAEELNSYSIFAILDTTYPHHVTNPQETAAQLAPLISMQPIQLERLLSSEDRFQVELGAGAKNLTYSEMLEIKDLELDGIRFIEEPRRYYPKQTYASHVIGYTDTNMDTARMGLERSLDDFLRAEDGLVQYQSDRRGVPLPDAAQHVTAPKNGHDVYLTLDSNIQTALEQVMTQVDEEYDPERMIAIVADPKTGEILAMSNRPSFNPNRYQEISNYMNYAVSDHFEPGSTMKVFTMAAAIEEGVYKGNDQFMSGQLNVGENVVSDHNRGEGWGQITFDEGMLRSSNVAFTKIALDQLGPEKLYDYMNKFGFNQPTGIDLPNEATSLIAKQNRFDAAVTSFGQGTAVTPIQQIQAATAIANDGKMMKPYLIDRIVNSETDAIVEKTEPEEVGTPISSETAKQVRNLLGEVVTSPVGTGRPYHIEGFDVAGKTGTAQIPNPNARGYIRGHGENIFSFLGMAPKDDPSLVVYVAVERPKLQSFESGSEPSAKIFNTIMKQSLQYLNITPDFEEITAEAKEGFVTEDYVGKNTIDVQEKLEAEGFNVHVLGEGSKIKAQEPRSGQGLLEGENIFLNTDSETFAMPDVTGWSNRDILKFANAASINPNLFGNGYAISQEVAAGEEVRAGDYIVFEFASLREIHETIDDRLDEEEEIEEQVGE